MSQEIAIKKHPGGVRTAEGKLVSRYNAQRHAILRESPSDYELAEAERIYEELSRDLKPAGKMQEVLIEMIGSDLIRSQRIERAETELIKKTLNPSLPRINLGGYDPQISHEQIEKLMLYSRYRTATQNRVFRTLGVLKQLQNYERNEN